MNIKRICLGFLAVALLLVPAHLLAADTADDNAPDTSVVTDLAVTGVTTERTTYKPGETIKGSFVLENADNFDHAGLSYIVQIGGDYEEPAAGYKFAGKYLDVARGDTIFSIPKSSKKTFAFSYAIPEFLSGKKLAVEIAIQTDDGKVVAFGDSGYIAIDGVPQSVVLKEATIVLSDGKKFNLGDGPTIYKDKAPNTASLKLSLTNQTKSDIVVTPTVLVGLQNNVGSKKAVSATAFTLHAGKTETASIDLPTMSYVPGVYLADVVLKDENGAQLESRIGARYIIGGNIATMHNPSVSKDILVQNEQFTFTTYLTGRAPDISELLSGKEPAALGAGKVEIKIFNEKNEVVATSNEDFKLAGDTTIQKDYSAARNSKALRLEANVYDDTGKLLLSYKKDLSVNYGDLAGVTESEGASPEMNLYLVMGGIALVVIIALIIIVMVARRTIPKKQGMLSIVALLLVASFPLAALADCSPASVSFTSISTPTKNQVMRPGEVFYTKGAISYNACENNPAGAGVTVGFRGVKRNGTSIGGTWSVGATGGSGWYPVAAKFKAGPFTAPTTPGTYRIGYSAGYIAGQCSGTATASRYIIVEAAPVNQPSSGCGAGQFYCDVTGRCMDNADSGTCNQKPDYVPFAINPDIPGIIGPVRLRGGLSATPPIVNKGDSCVVNWSKDFAQYDGLTICTFKAPGTTVDFKPGDTSAPLSASIPNIQNDVPYEMTCGESDGLTPSTTDTGVCRLNWNYKEIP